MKKVFSNLLLLQFFSRISFTISALCHLLATSPHTFVLSNQKQQRYDQQNRNFIERKERFATRRRLGLDCDSRIVLNCTAGLRSRCHYPIRLGGRYTCSGNRHHQPCPVVPDAEKRSTCKDY